MKKLKALALAALAMIPGQALAYDWVVSAKVTLIEGTYFPSAVPFQLNAGGGNCPAGSFIWWYPQGADDAAKGQNYHSMLALLLTAKSTGQTVTIYGNNSGCTVQFFHLS